MQLVNILGPITLITLIGYFLGRSSVGLQSRTLSSVVILVATPALVFNTLTSMKVSVATIGLMSGAALLCVIIGGVIAAIGLKISGASWRSFLPSLSLPNSGNMGLPLVVLAFGSEGARLGISFFFVIALVQYSAGLSIASGSIRIKDMARQPLLYSVFLVLLVTIFQVPVPQVILKTTEILGGMMIPAMLILLGSSLSTLEVSDLKPSLIMAVARLLIGLMASLAVVAILGLTGVAAGIVFLMGTMPSAIITYVFAERYGQSANKVAGAVVMSTVLTFCCLPGLVWIALWMAGSGVTGDIGAAGIGGGAAQ